MGRIVEAGPRHDQFVDPESTRYLFGVVRGILGAMEQRGRLFVAQHAVVVAKGVEMGGRHYPSMADIFVAPPIGTIITDPDELTAFVASAVPHMRLSGVERAQPYKGDGFTMPWVGYANKDQRVTVVGLPEAGLAGQIAEYQRAQRNFRVELEDVRDGLSIGITGEQLKMLQQGTLVLPELHRPQFSTLI